MSHGDRRTRRSVSVMLLAYVMGVALIGQAPAASASTTATTAWHDGSFHVDVPGVVHSSDVVLGRPNTASAQAMPLGKGVNGRHIHHQPGDMDGNDPHHRQVSRDGIRQTARA